MNFDDSSRIWIGTIDGLAIFNGAYWIVYNQNNSELPNNIVMTIDKGIDKNMWLGTYGGLVELKDTVWTIYNTDNSDIPENDINSLSVDSAGNKWIGNNGYNLVKFDGENWELYYLPN